MPLRRPAEPRPARFVLLAVLASAAWLAAAPRAADAFAQPTATPRSGTPSATERGSTERPTASPPARAAIVVDARDGTVLFAYYPDARYPIASATKLMTALLARERLPLDRVVPAARYRAAPAESVLGLAPGEPLSVRDLIAGTLLASANDAAATLARAVAGTERRFVALMNRRARQLELRRTRFANPIGLDAPGAGSTARELAALARRALRDRFIARVVAMPRALLSSGLRRRVVANRNDLVGRFPWVDGVKTGHTAGAGYVLVASAHGRLGQRVVSVVLGAPSEAARDRYSLALLRYGLSRYRLDRVLDPARTRREVATSDGRRAVVAPARRVAIVMRGGQRARVRLQLAQPLRGPLGAGTPVGRFDVLVDGRRAASATAVLADPLASSGFLAALEDRLGGGLTILLLVAMLAVVAAALRRARPRRATRRPGVDHGR